MDVSLGEILIESHDIIDANNVNVVFVNKDNKIFSIVGSVVHSEKIENGKAKTCLCFHGNDEESIKFTTNLICTYHCGNRVSQATSTV